MVLEDRSIQVAAGGKRITEILVHFCQVRIQADSLAQFGSGSLHVPFGKKGVAQAVVQEGQIGAEENPFPKLNHGAIQVTLPNESITQIVVCAGCDHPLEAKLTAWSVKILTRQGNRPAELNHSIIPLVLLRQSSAEIRMFLDVAHLRFQAGKE